ncbi:MAG: aldo/keto reductase [Myxococcales bacterium FL481]|nr:MAG: aldo/keto reductase [Myxococcales bacterium FL481]
MPVKSSSSCDSPSEQVALGQDGVTVSRLVLGGMALSQAASTQAAARLVDEATDLGIRAIDTAPLYGYGTSERVLGRVIASRRDQLEVLTKVGLRWDDSHGEVLFAVDDPRLGRVTVRRDGRPESIRREVEASLQRLGLERLGLVQLHHVDPDIALAETMGELAELRQQGKLRAIGICNATRAQVQAAQRATGGNLVAIQCEYNLLARHVETEALTAARESGTAFLAYSPLAQGILAGRMLDGRALPHDYRAHEPAFAARNLERIHERMHNAMVPLAEAHRTSLAAVALAWVLARPGVAAVIAGASEPRQLATLAPALTLRLPASDHAHLDRAFRGLRLVDPSQPTLARRVARRARRWVRAAIGRRRV